MGRINAKREDDTLKCFEDDDSDKEEYPVKRKDDRLQIHRGETDYSIERYVYLLSVGILTDVCHGTSYNGTLTVSGNIKLNTTYQRVDNDWLRLGSEIGNGTKGLCVVDGILYAIAGGGVSVFDDETLAWSILPTLPGGQAACAIAFNGELYLGINPGFFGGIFVYRDDDWIEVGALSYGESLATDGTTLWAGGNTSIYEWDGVDTWDALAGSFTSFAMCYFDGYLTAWKWNGDVATGIYQWNGVDTWVQLGADTFYSDNGGKCQLYPDGTDLYAVSANESTINKWNGASWSAMGALDDACSMLKYNGDLYAFATGGVYRWSGSAWDLI